MSEILPSTFEGSLVIEKKLFVNALHFEIVRGDMTPEDADRELALFNEMYEEN